MKTKEYVALAAVVMVMGVGITPASATIIGDPIDHATPLFHGPGGEFFTGPGAPAAPVIGGLGVDISTGFGLPAWDYIIVYDFFGAPAAGLAFLETHDMEWIGVPGAVPPVITVWGTPGAAAGYLGGFAGLTGHDVDGSLFGFDVHIDFAAGPIVPGVDLYVIAFNDPHTPVGTGVGPPGVFPGLIPLDSFVVPAPAGLALLGLGILGVRGRHR